MAWFELQGLGISERSHWSLGMEPGECVALSGPSGSGKSRLLRAIADLDPHTGEACLDGVGCSAMPAPAWRQAVGLLPAESAWWAPTVGEHFATPPAEAELERLGLVKASLTWAVARCSTGERQRLALLRLLSQGPRVLLLDEPTASLDARNVTVVEAMVADYLRQHRAAAIWVSHDPAQVQRVAGRRFQIGKDTVEERPWT